MLNKLIPHIDIGVDELDQFSKIYGLAERIRAVKDENSQEFPAVFIGNGEYEQINMDLPACYHRMIGERTISILGSENTTGCSDAFEMTYPMGFVGCMNHSPGCETYETDSMANSVAYKLFQTSFGKAIRSLVKVFDIKLFITSIETDRVRIWEEEYSNVPIAMTFEKIYFLIKYDLKIKGDNSCLNIIEC